MVLSMVITNDDNDGIDNGDCSVDDDLMIAVSAYWGNALTMHGDGMMVMMAMLNKI